MYIYGNATRTAPTAAPAAARGRGGVGGAAERRAPRRLSLACGAPEAALRTVRSGVGVSCETVTRERGSTGSAERSLSVAAGAVRCGARSRRPSLRATSPVASCKKRRLIYRQPRTNSNPSDPHIHHTAHRINQARPAPHWWLVGRAPGRRRATRPQTRRPPSLRERVQGRARNSTRPPRRRGPRRAIGRRDAH